MRPGLVHGHGSASGWRSASRQSWNWRSQNRWSRYGRNSWLWNGGGFYGSGLWYGPYGYAGAGPGGGGAPVIIGVGAPSFTAFPAAANETGDPGPQGGCVLHKLTYDSAGHYVGERQTPQC
jgi:hypothetical protein